MKFKIVPLFIALLLLSVGQAMAKEVNLSATVEQTLQWVDNLDFQSNDATNAGNEEDDFAALQRITLGFEYGSNEYLRAVVSAEIDTMWGAPDNGNDYGGGAIGTDGGVLQLLHAYTDFTTADITWRVGLQGLAWPSATYGSPVLDTDVAGIVASYSFNEQAGLTLAWVRAEDGQDNFTSATANVEDQNNDEVDLVSVLLPLTMDGWSLTPYATYGLVGGDSALSGESGLAGPNAVARTDNLDALWAGAALEISAFDPLTIGVDLVYGSLSGDEAEANDRSGWFFASKALYKLDSCTPGLLAFYGSGEDEDVSNGSEALPTLDGGFSPTHFGFDGNLDTVSGGLLGSRTDMVGLGLVIEDISFTENLTHRLALLYGRGTSSKEMGDLHKNAGNGLVLTEEDSFWEINVDSTYQVYENLALAAQVGYLAVDWDEDAWANASEREDAMKLSFTLTYEF